MAQSIIPFNFHSHAVRIVMRDGNPWFVATDVCTALGYRNPSKALGDHLDSDERTTINVPTPNATLGVPTNIISESGLYALILRSRKPEARKFAKWVTSEVLPSIRKTGSYTATGTMVNEDVLYNIWFLCCHFKGLYEMSFDNKVPQALAWLGAKRMGGRLYTHLVDGMDGGVLRIEKAIGPHLEQAAQKGMGNASRHLS
ncbi:Bro-N domain-containing protein [Xylella fastidiosa subsp. multiplex]|uniref:BRO-N domain-containing protein n=2 Tax=Xylella fastidiosa TaxID=2371 RepID=UPI002366C476|nr:Bro-N domain-containing protein [Xylella fastidiosa]WDF08048.1 Bro-N domain-containing protein [Xylella fastidiosa subsp. multiplex]